MIPPGAFGQCAPATLLSHHSDNGWTLDKEAKLSDWAGRPFDVGRPYNLTRSAGRNTGTYDDGDRDTLQTYMAAETQRAQMAAFYRGRPTTCGSAQARNRASRAKAKRAADRPTAKVKPDWPRVSKVLANLRPTHTWHAWSSKFYSTLQKIQQEDQQQAPSTACAERDAVSEYFSGADYPNLDTRPRHRSPGSTDACPTITAFTTISQGTASSGPDKTGLSEARGGTGATETSSVAAPALALAAAGPVVPAGPPTDSRAY